MCGSYLTCYSCRCVGTLDEVCFEVKGVTSSLGSRTTVRRVGTVEALGVRREGVPVSWVLERKARRLSRDSLEVRGRGGSLFLGVH